LIRQVIIFSFLFCHSLNLQGQFLDDFSDSDLNSNPVWEGEVEEFRVNEQEMLQLDAPSGDQSQLYTQLDFPDSIQWDIEVLLDFSPSANNSLRLYLSLDELNLEQASGYYLEIGENGANDALHFYALSEGSSELIASGEMAALAAEPAFAKIRVTYFPTGQWSISTSYSEAQALSEELVFMHTGFDPSSGILFLIDCLYTSSRSDKFFFDNIGIKKYEVDREGPEVVSVELIDMMSIGIQASEKLDIDASAMPSNFEIEGFAGSITVVESINDDQGLRLLLSETLTSGIYQVVIQGLTDVLGNLGEASSFSVFVMDEAEAGDLAVNEILFNPETGGSDYVEILNISDKFISLANLSIANLDKEDTKSIESEITLLPGEYICFTEDVDNIVSRYAPPSDAMIANGDLPAFNNDVGNVSIINNANGVLIDTYDYSEEQHFSELKDLNGVSLERVSPLDDKWFSASAAVGFGTPGYQNSAFLNPTLGGEDVLTFENKTFSPNQDGMDDQLVIKYSLPENGYQVDLFILDQYGRQVRSLVNNELFSKEGFVLWDGLDDTGESLEIGIYFVIIEGFNVLGDVISMKRPAILADFLK